MAYVKTDLFQEADIGKLNKAFVEFWKQYIKTEEEKKEIYFSFVLEVEDDNRILKSIVRNNSGIMMYKRRYRLGAVYNRYYNRLEILPVYRYSRYKNNMRNEKRICWIVWAYRMLYSLTTRGDHNKTEKEKNIILEKILLFCYFIFVISLDF